MSGHSKWSKIKRQKAVTDIEKARSFAKLSKLVTLAVVEGGGIGDPDLNVRLRLAIDKAKQGNMPKENIERAIEKASGPNKNLLKEVHYEAFAKHGVALLIVATTDNPNRTTSEVKSALDRHSGKLGAQGSVSYLFQHCATVICPKSENSEERVFSFATAIEAYDIDEEADSFVLYVPFHNIGKIKQLSGDIKITSQEIEYRPLTPITVPKESEILIVELIESLESLDDVQNVYTNTVFTTL